MPFEFDPPKPAFDAFRNTFSQPDEITPLGRAGNSHFGYVRPIDSWHISTQIGGFGKREGLDNGLKIVDDLDFLK